MQLSYKEIVFLFDQFKKDISQNKDLYSDPYKIINFRNWIKLLFNDKKKILLVNSTPYQIQTNLLDI